jgi:peptide/nickel transport system permease protein
MEVAVTATASTPTTTTPGKRSRMPRVQRVSLARRSSARKRRRQLPWFAIIVLSIVVLLAVFAPLLANHEPNVVNLTDRITPPMWADGGNPDYWLGTDRLGRDIASRLMYGARNSLIVGLVGIIVGGTIGLVVGIIAGYKGGFIGTVLMRFVDGFLALPLLLIAMVMAIGLGQGIDTLILAVSLILWSRFARLIRGEVLELLSQEYLLQARVSGVSSMRIMRVHILPNVANTFIVLLTLNLAWVILVEASLSFLGAGIPPPEASWGGMIADGRDNMANGWWISVFPGIALALTILAVNLLGDWLRDRLDPKLRQI